MTHRGWRFVALGMALVTMIVGIASPLTVGAVGDGNAVANETVYMRSGPSKDAEIVGVIPQGASIEIRGREDNGFLPVTYEGIDGWVMADFTDVAAEPEIPNQTATTVLPVQILAEPDSASRTVVIVPMGEVIVITATQENGYRLVVWSGYEGYALEGSLPGSSNLPAPTDNRAMTSGPDDPVSTMAVSYTKTYGYTTSDLSLRTGPSSAYPSRMLIPRGSSVLMTGQYNGGLMQVIHRDTAGWILAKYVKTPGALLPACSSSRSQIGGPSRLAWAARAYAQPSSASPLVFDAPGGSIVSLTGSVSGSYRQASWNGKTGWIAVGPMTIWGTLTANTPALRIYGDNYEIALTIPAGAYVGHAGSQCGGYYSVTYAGRTYWIASSAYRVSIYQGALSSPVNATGSGYASVDTHMFVGAGNTSALVRIVPKGSWMEFTGRVNGWYREVVYGSATGWIHLHQISVPAKTISASTIQSSPGGSVLSSIPSGASVTLTQTQSNGYYTARYNGIAGWIPASTLDLNKYTPVASSNGFDWTNAIASPSRGSVSQALAVARSRGALRMTEVDAYIREMYRLAPLIGFDPAILVAQSAHETAYWTSYWWNARLNPAGLGITGDPDQNNASKTYRSGTEAARGQITHMHAEVYGPAVPLPAILQGTDPTYQNVFEAGWAGTVWTLDDLTGTWATDPSYGWKLARVAAYMFG